MSIRGRTAIFFLTILWMASVANADHPPGGPVIGDAPAASVFYHHARALVVGIDRYGSGQIAPLRWAEADARDVARVLRDGYGYEVSTLTGAAATRQAVMSAIGELLDRGNAEAGLLYFAAHGQTVPDRNGSRVGFIVPYDASVILEDVSDLDQWRREAIDMSNLAQRVRKSRMRHVLVVADVCYSGALGKRTGKVLPPHLYELLERPSKQVISAGTEGQESLEVGGHGVFTAALLRQLQRETAASVTQVFLDVRREVVRKSDRRMLPQLRDLVADNGEFVFVPKDVQDVEAAVDEVRGHALARGGLKTTLADLFSAIDGSDYRGSAHAEESRQRWAGRVGRFTQAASLGDALAMGALYFAYAHGLGTAPDPRNALRWAREAFDLESPVGPYVLGHAYVHGVGLDQNRPAGRKLIANSAASGFAPALAWVALDDLEHQKSPKLARQAVARLERVADAGLLSAKTGLARAFLLGIGGVTPDRKRALELLQGAARADYPIAKLVLAEAYSSSSRQGDRAKIPPLLREAAEDGLAKAQFFLAAALCPAAHAWSGPALLGLEESCASAREWARMAADQEDPDGLYLLGILYERGLGGTKNFDRARKLVEDAAARNHAGAIAYQGQWYLRGAAYKRDAEKGIQLLERAAALGNAEAMYLLGYWYEHLAVVPDTVALLPPQVSRLHFIEDIDLPEAFHWYCQAAAAGHPQAIQQLKSLGVDAFLDGGYAVEADRMQVWLKKYPADQKTAKAILRRSRVRSSTP